MRTPKRSSQATTTSTMVRLSTSRSLSKVASRVTFSAGTPETSSRTSARPVRTSVAVSVMCILLAGVGAAGQSGEDDDLGGGGEAGAEAGEQDGVAGGHLPELEQAVEGQRHRGRGRVAAVDDVARDDDVV